MQPQNTNICTGLVCKSKLQKMNASNATERAQETEQTFICHREINIWHFLCLSGMKWKKEGVGIQSKGLFTPSIDFQPFYAGCEIFLWVIQPGTRVSKRHQSIVLFFKIILKRAWSIKSHCGKQAQAKKVI